MVRLLKTSVEGNDFSELIGKEVTFANDLVSESGNLINKKGEKAIISDVEYIPSYWSKLCPDIHIEARVSTLYINDMTHVCYLPDTFLEFKLIEKK